MNTFVASTHWALFMQPTTASSKQAHQSDGPPQTLEKLSDLDLKKVHRFRLRAAKRAIDVLGATTFFVLFGWMYAILWLGVVITSGRPAIYSQTRYGKDGREFRFFKFRSMVLNSEEVLTAHLKKDKAAARQWRDFQKLDDDPRITKFGAFIRKTSLDELPQFWNVLVGDMSLVGPRPCMINQKELYGSYWSHYTCVKPGITGLWQVSGRNQLTYHRRVALDVEYVETLSISNDLSIVGKTFRVVLSGHGSK